MEFPRWSCSRKVFAFGISFVFLSGLNSLSGISYVVFVRKGYLAEPSLLSFLIDFSRWNSLGGISWVEFLRRSFLVGTSLASVSLKRIFLAGFLQVEFPRWNSQGGDSWLEFPGLLFSHGIVLENLADLGLSLIHI